MYNAKRHAHTAQGLAISTIHGDLLWCDGGWPGGCHEHELIELAGLQGVLDDVEVASLLDRGFRGLAKVREYWHAPVEQSTAHLANAWALRRWRGLLYRVQDVFRAPRLILVTSDC